MTVLAGKAVVINDVDEPLADLITSRGGKAVVSVGPVQDPDQAEAMVGTCTVAFDRQPRLGRDGRAADRAHLLRIQRGRRQHHGRCGPPPETIAPLVTYLLSDRSAKITGQLIRFANQKLHVMGQTSPREPVLEREAWDVDSIAEAFERQIVPEDPARVRWGVGR
ncbi:hypothetical protein SAMN04488074_106367 [Lentzea albidocapillata subsp. violacea]|uniref:Short chain dehydrogenase n=1 Tax=Lentzea albidocapillata subsp. violacea TaxID=128104 RepID=A0A1G9DRR4_9PSEU|nr:hypothetical protein [Lentzea albidocapillata]SDK66577.1 hypothetical protein SAMN04488074_106367 [Lentzea albidocapillata subsp. violacea]